MRPMHSFQAASGCQATLRKCRFGLDESRATPCRAIDLVDKASGHATGIIMSFFHFLRVQRAYRCFHRRPLVPCPSVLVVILFVEVVKKLVKRGGAKGVVDRTELVFLAVPPLEILDVVHAEHDVNTVGRYCAASGLTGAHDSKVLSCVGSMMSSASESLLASAWDLRRVELPLCPSLLAWRIDETNRL